jgi:hypothetical protein
LVDVRTPEESRGRERDLDSLIGMELASDSPAAKLLWKSVGKTSPGAALVRFQAKRGDQRTTDVHATGGGITLLIENKVPGGHYEFEQAESYGNERMPSIVLAITIGPRSFKGYFLQKQTLFDAFVAIEDLAEALRDAIQQPGTEAELRAGYKHRAERYDALARPIAPLPLDAVVSFGTLYRELANQRTNGRVQISEGSFNRGPRAEFTKGAPVRAPFRAMHKLRQNVLDVLLVGWTFTQLQDLWSTIEESQKPRGWTISEQLNSRAAKATGETIPVLRYAVGGVAEMSADGFLAARDVIVDVVDALAEMGLWIDRHVPGTSPSPESLVDNLLRRAAQIAAQDDEAKAEAIRRIVRDRSS